MSRVGLLLVAAGCIEFGIDPIDPDGEPRRLVPVVETFVQAPQPRVDLLFVIDDTASMQQEQLALAAEFGGLAQELDAAGVAWQVGAVTTSMTGDEAGWLQGSPYVLTPDLPDREDAFAAMVQVGTDGSSPEAGLAAAVEALRLASPQGPNAGFRRPDAVLHVVFVSDADDQSEAWLGPDPLGAFLDVLADEARATGLPARASGLVGDVPSGCTSATGTAQAAFRYADAADAADGVAVSICAADFGPLLSTLGEASLAWPTRFPLREVPEVGTTRVTIDGEALGGWFFDEAGTAVVFKEAPPPEAVIEIRYLVRNEG